MSQEVEAGQLLDGRFKITELIARSGMASIFKAIDNKTNETVAIKIPFMQFESDPAFFSRFQREEQIGLKLSHPSILRIVPAEDKSRPYLAMEYLEGKTLGEILRKEKKLPTDRALKIASRIADALSYMHAPPQDVVHRDLKPDNVMVCNDGSIRIMDFGIAKGGQRRITFAGFSSTMGTPDYMAPEQVKGQRGDGRTDIYSLGAILYEMLTGQTPFHADNPYELMNLRVLGDPVGPRKINADIPPAVEEIILHAMERKPADRYANAQELKSELDHPESVKVTGRCERLQAPVVWKSKWRPYRMLILALLIPLLVVAVLLLLMH